MTVEFPSRFLNHLQKPVVILKSGLSRNVVVATHGKATASATLWRTYSSHSAGDPQETVSAAVSAQRLPPLAGPGGTRDASQAMAPPALTGAFGMPSLQSHGSRLSVRTAASAGGRAGGANASLRQRPAALGLSLPEGLGSLRAKEALAMQQALDVLTRPSNRTFREVVRDACVHGYHPHFDALLCLIRTGVLDPNGDHVPSGRGVSFLHAIAMHADDGLDYAPGFTTIEERVAGLVAAGADVNLRCQRQGLTPLDHACLRGAEAVVKALRSRGAEPQDRR